MRKMTTAYSTCVVVPVCFKEQVGPSLYLSVSRSKQDPRCTCLFQGTSRTLVVTVCFKEQVGPSLYLSVSRSKQDPRCRERSYILYNLTTMINGLHVPVNWFVVVIQHIVSTLENAHFEFQRISFYRYQYHNQTRKMCSSII